MSDTAIEARGKAAFMESGLNRLGSRRSKIGARKPGLLYEQGWAEGLTLPEAQEAAERKWAALTPEQKNAWAERGGAGNFAPSEIRAAALGMGMVDPSTKSAEAADLAKKRSDIPFVGPPRPVEPRKAQVREMFQGSTGSAGESGKIGPVGAVTPALPGESSGVPAMLVRPAEQSSPDSGIPTDDKIRSRPEVAAAYAAKRGGVAGPVGSVGASKPTLPSPDGRLVIGDLEAKAASESIGAKVNPATGLPFGHMPGSPLGAGADPSMVRRAGESAARQAEAGMIPAAREVGPAPKQMFAGGVPAGEYLSPAELQRRIGERDRASIPGTGMFESDRRIEEKRKMFLADEAKFMAGSNEGLRFKDESAGKPAVVRGRLPFAKRV